MYIQKKSLETFNFISVGDAIRCPIYNLLLLAFQCILIQLPWQDFHLFIFGAQFAHDLGSSEVQEIACPPSWYQPPIND